MLSGFSNGGPLKRDKLQFICSKPNRFMMVVRISKTTFFKYLELKETPKSFSYVSVIIMPDFEPNPKPVNTVKTHIITDVFWCSESSLKGIHPNVSLHCCEVQAHCQSAGRNHENEVCFYAAGIIAYIQYITDSFTAFCTVWTASCHCNTIFRMALPAGRFINSPLLKGVRHIFLHRSTHSKPKWLLVYLYCV